MTVARSDSALLRRELDRRGLDEDEGATATLRFTAWASLIAIVLATVVSIAFADAVWVALPGFVWLSVGVLTLAAGASAALLWQESRGQNSRGLNRPGKCGGSLPWKRGWSHAEGKITR